MTKYGRSWKLLLTAVTESLVLNETWRLDPTLYPKLTTKTPEQRLTLLCIVTWTYFVLYSNIIIAEICWNRTTKCRLGLRNYSFRQSSCFQNYQKSIFLYAGKICWAKCFHTYSPKIRLRNNNFSRQRLKKISQTLNWKLVMACCILHLNNDVKTNNEQTFN